MNTEFGNIISTARHNAGLTQEKAAEILNVVPRTLAYYENGYRSVPDDIALKMSELYHQPSLVYCWLRLCTRCGNEILPALMNRPLSENILDTLAGIEHMQQKASTLISIGRDGVIDETESNIFQKLIITCFKPFTRSMFALSLVTFPNKKATDIGVSAAHVNNLSK